MKLADYIRAERGNGSKLAAGLGIALSYLSQMASGHRPVPPSMCPTIERLTNEQVRCEELNDTVDWAAIRSTKPADPAPATEAV